MAETNFEADFTPCIDMGWRLRKEVWGRGLAAEGAKRCLEFAFTRPKVKKVFALAPEANLPSERVMKKIGMRKIKHFRHPLLAGNERLVDCVLYAIELGQF